MDSGASHGTIHACLGITGAMQTTPTAAMEAMSSASTYCAGGGSPDGSLQQNRILNMRSDRIGRDIVFHKPYRVIVPKEGEEDRSHTPVQQNETIWYTDGSKTEQSTGAGATNRDPGCEISINLGNYATVFEAEVTATSACAQEMIRRSYTNKMIQIISDSQAALKALGAVEIHSQVVKDCMDSLTQLAEHNSITLKWMRGHQGQEGNERADFLAKKWAEVPLIWPEPTCGLAYRTARRVMKDLLRENIYRTGRKAQG
ncbi:hypothetical protein NQ318_011335 [Aromia moschata]|uniref:RNase H type-1 domain-containing protein n=1 Tax=Aromia moschata TaxID=1265417 RepID=A0AAV8X9G9_9CUCU|nr:hypothetical protein NQ318_011335 [Aromia moschata]